MKEKISISVNRDNLFKIKKLLPKMFYISTIFDTMLRYMAEEIYKNQGDGERDMRYLIDLMVNNRKKEKENKEQ